jgi:2,4-dienoyl-CoA reductase-like NADH-dependent reductase (Old Yellow Enzyme family)
MSTALFSPLRLRDVTFKNRVFVSPMCQYSSEGGLAQPWHMVHLGGLAVGGAALVMVEATAVTAEGRISPGDMGLWSEAHTAALAPIARFIAEQGAVPAIQIGHAGRKASTAVPWAGGGPVAIADGGWEPIAPSAVAFKEGWHVPRAMTVRDLDATVDAFVAAAGRARAAGFEVVELHMAHGYLLQEFLSPLSNTRDDEYGGSLENRMRFPLRVAEAVRAAWPASRPLFARISASDWVPGGWDIEQSVTFARALADRGVDLVDCSSGGNVATARIPVEPGYQVPFAERIRRDACVATGAVGLITEARQAESILAEGKADAIFLARALLRDPRWPLHAARELGVDVEWPKQYLRAKG